MAALRGISACALTDHLNVIFDCFCMQATPPGSATQPEVIDLSDSDAEETMAPQPGAALPPGGSGPQHDSKPQSGAALPPAGSGEPHDSKSAAEDEPMAGGAIPDAAPTAAGPQATGADAVEALAAAQAASVAEECTPGIWFEVRSLVRCLLLPILLSCSRPLHLCCTHAPGLDRRVPGGLRNWPKGCTFR